MKFTKAQQEAYLQHLRDGERRGAAADQLELDRIAVRKYIEEHPAFEEQVMYAEIDADEHVLEALFQAAVSGNVPAAKLWLERAESMHERVLNKPPGRPEPAPKPVPDEPELDEQDIILGVTPLDPRRRRRRG